MARVEVRFDGVSRGARAAARDTVSGIDSVGTAATRNQRRVHGLGREIRQSMTGAVSSIARVSALVGGVGGGGLAGSVIFAGFKFNDLKQRAQIAFETMLGSGQKARRFLDELAKFAEKTPFEFKELIPLSQKLMTAGFEANKIIPILTRVGDAVAAMGGDPQAMESTIRAITQIQAKGRVMAEEMMQLNEAGTFSWRALSKEIGVSVPAAMKLVEKGSVSADAFMAAFVANTDQRFGGMSERISHTFGGMLSTIKDRFTQTSGTAMRPFFDLATEGMEAIIRYTSRPEFTAGVERLAQWLRDVVVPKLRELAQWVVDNRDEIAGVFKRAAGFAAGFAKAVTGSLEALRPLAGFLGVDMVNAGEAAFGLVLLSKIAKIRTALVGTAVAGGAASGGLLGTLSRLSKGPWVIGITLAITNMDAVQRFADKVTGQSTEPLSGNATLPTRDAKGVWRAADRSALPAAGQRYWEGKYRAGAADGSGTRPSAAPAGAQGGGTREQQLVRTLEQAGYKGENLKMAFAVAMAESGGRPGAYNPDVSTGDQSYGLFQINMLGQMGPGRRKQYGLKSNQDLYDPDVNARVAYQMSGGGRNWGPWSTYKTGAYRQYLDDFPGQQTGGTAQGPLKPSSVKLSGDLDAKPQALDFARKVGQIAGRSTLNVSSGYRSPAENKATGGSPTSEHMSGTGIDISAYGDELIRLGQSALIAAGMPAEKALREKGGLYNVNGYQIIFNTMKGGDHTDHLHVGVGRARGPLRLPDRGPDRTFGKARDLVTPGGGAGRDRPDPADRGELRRARFGLKWVGSRADDVKNPEARGALRKRIRWINTDLADANTEQEASKITERVQKLKDRLADVLGSQSGRQRDAAKRLGDQVAGAAKNAVDRASQAVTAARGRFSQSWGRMADMAGRIFDTKTRQLVRNARANVMGFEIGEGEQTPGEKKLEGFREGREKMRMQQRRDEINRRISELSTPGAEETDADRARREQELLDAQRELQDMQFDEQERALEKQAATERTAADQALAAKREQIETERALLKEQLELRLEAIRQSMEDGTITAEEGLVKLRDLFQSPQWRAEFADAGKLLGSTYNVAFNQAIKSSLKDAGRMQDSLGKQADSEAGMGGNVNLNDPNQLINRRRGPQAFARGGKVPGMYIGRDSVPALLTPGETVIDRDLTRRLEAIAAGGLSGNETHLHVHVTGNTLLGSDRYVALEIAKVVEPEIRRIVSSSLPYEYR